MAKRRKKPAIRKFKRKQSSKKSSMIMDMLYAAGSFAAGNLIGNYATKLTGNKAIGTAATAAGIFLPEFITLPSKSMIQSGFLTASLVQLGKSELLPENEYLKLMLSGEEENTLYLVSGTNSDPLAGREPEPAATEEIYLSGNNDPLD